MLRDGFKLEFLCVIKTDKHRERKKEERERKRETSTQKCKLRKIKKDKGYKEKKRGYNYLWAFFCNLLRTRDIALGSIRVKHLQKSLFILLS